jgi:hypothetical protein
MSHAAGAGAALGGHGESDRGSALGVGFAGGEGVVGGFDAAAGPFRVLAAIAVAIAAAARSGAVALAAGAGSWPRRGRGAAVGVGAEGDERGDRDRRGLATGTSGA